MAGPLLIEDQTPQINERSAALMAQVLQFQQRQALDERQQMDIEAYRQQQLANTQNRLAFDQQRDQQKQSQMAADAQGVASGQVVPGMTAGGINTMTLVQQRAMQERERRFSSAVSFLQPYVLSGSKMAQYNLDALASDHFGQDMTGMGESLFRGQLDKFVAQKDYEAKIKDEQRRRESEAAMNFFGIANPSFSGMSPTLQGQYLAEQARQQRESDKQMTPEQADAFRANLTPNAQRRFDALAASGQPMTPSTLFQLTAPEKPNTSETAPQRRLAQLALKEADELDSAIDEAVKEKPDASVVTFRGASIPLGYARRRADELRQAATTEDARASGSGEPSTQLPPVKPGETREQYRARVKAMMGGG